MASSFIDKATIRVAAGRGGDGAVAFHREKYVAAVGPDGGDGGRGGDVIVTVDDHMSTLMDFRYKRKYVAGNGMNGNGRRCSGKDGESLTIKVPRGTLIRDKATGGILHDMSGDEPFVVAKGGKGGWGNQHFATPTRQVPRFAKPGLPGEDREVVLELKLLADVGLVGFPNVGKSTLLSVVSKAHPKIANYHFTTLFPNLGVVYVKEGVSFVMADIPGIIEGASEGAGLGHDFLRHIDRCRLLIHLVDVSGSEGRDPVEDFETINTELRRYSEALAERPQLVVANKCDLLSPEDRAPIERLKAHVEKLGYRFFELSAATQQGTRELMLAAAGELAELPPILRYEPDYVAPLPTVDTSGELEYRKLDADYWSVEGPWLQSLLSRVNLGDYEGRIYFDRVLREAGVFTRLEELGIRDGDTVGIYDLEFEYQS
ncbi:MAG: GTPase ObgE [Oscillospiraceae bacterium]|nr:GTPase ObgE [Oscillospiraceae bacterium]